MGKTLYNDNVVDKFLEKRRKNMSKNNEKMRISSRVVNVKRHTQGYMISGKLHSVSQTKSLAANGRIAGVRVIGDHIQAIPGRRRLSDLPVRVDRPNS